MEYDTLFCRQAKSDPRIISVQRGQWHDKNIMVSPRVSGLLKEGRCFSLQKPGFDLQDALRIQDALHRYTPMRM